jgi:hypothetical protein
MTEYPKFSDFAKGESKLDGEKIKLKDALNQEILILNYAILRSKFKDENYLTIQFELGSVRHVVFTGSGVLMDQIKKYAEKIPFYTVIRDFGKYYAFT